MSDVCKETRFVKYGDCMYAYDYPLDFYSIVKEYHVDDHIMVEITKHVVISGKLILVTDNGIILRSRFGRLGILFNNMLSVKKINNDNENYSDTPDESVHDLTCQLLFGTTEKPEFKYTDLSESIKMPPERFQELLDELDGNSLQTLKEKNARYSTDGDSLHNFRSGSEIAGGTSAQACWGYMTKHLVALRDMVEKNDFSNREDFLEKCQDTINYIRFLWCIGNEEITEEKETERDRECAYESCDGSTCIGPKAFNDCPGYSKCELYTPNSFAK